MEASNLINKLTPRAIAAQHVDYCGNRNVRVFQIKEIFCPPAAAAMSDASVAAHSCWGL